MFHCVLRIGSQYVIHFEVRCLLRTKVVLRTWYYVVLCIAYCDLCIVLRILRIGGLT